MIRRIIFLAVSATLLAGCAAAPATSGPTVTQSVTVMSSADLTVTAEASVVTATVTASPTQEPTPEASPESTDPGPADEHEAFHQVDEVIDGDTIRVFIDGFSTPIRVLGINTPETVDPNKPIECYGPEASAKMGDLVTGVDVILTVDATQGGTDRYGRLLRYVTAGDTGEDVSAYLLRWGFARYVEYDGPLERTDLYVASETEAKTNARGGWAAKEAGGCGW